MPVGGTQAYRTIDDMAQDHPSGFTLIGRRGRTCCPGSVPAVFVIKDKGYSYLLKLSDEVGVGNLAVAKR